eukprot:TCALIF_09387-PA protein Name:"Protein of unknown function" AED:0.33 eAED:0.33 QI:22/0.4/0.16/0.5/1/0.83/6/0/194
MISTCGATVTRNCSYIKNPGFPTAYTDTASCTFTIAKCDPSVCDFRLDFDQFTLNGPSGTLELNEGDCNTDSLTSTTVGYCCITYTPCATPTPSFALDPAGENDLSKAMVDAMCMEDFIRIEEGRCVGSLNGRNIFCGGILSDANDAEANCPIQDCTQPFQVGVFTNAAIAVANGVTVANGNRGVCLEYTQQPC